jgi:hypothetical protein
MYFIKGVTMKKSIILIILFFVTLMFQNVATACVYLNDFEKSFPQPDSIVIGSEMIDGSANFLESYSAAMLVLYERERGDKDFFDIEKSLGNLDIAIFKLEQSKNNYSTAHMLGTKNVYVRYRIDQLKNFNYNTFCSENKLNILLMEEVTQLLSKGDVIGIYRKNLENVDALLNILYELKGVLKSGNKPDISLYWEMLRLYSHTILFGNYATSAAQQAFGIE